MLPKIRQAFLAVTLALTPAMAVADEVLASEAPAPVMVDMEGFFSDQHSTPYVEIIHKDELHSLNWHAVKTMIESNDFKGLPEAQVLEACKSLQNTIDTWSTDDNIGSDALPPRQYPCQKLQFLG